MRRAIVFLLVSAILLWLPSLTLFAETEKANDQKKEQKKELTKGQQKTQPGKGQSEQPADSTNRVLAKIGNISITQQEFELQFGAALERFPADKKNMFINPHGRRQFLNMLVDQKIWINWALEQGMDKDQEVQTLFRMSRDQILLRRTSEEIFVRSIAKEAEVRKFYDANPDRFMGPVKAEVWTIVLSDSTEATQVLGKLKAGADFAKLAKEKSKDKSTAAAGGDLGLLTQGSALPSPVGGYPELEKVIFSLKSGDISDVIKTADTYQIVKVDKRIEPKVRPFESVRQRIEEGLTGDMVTKIRGEVFQDLKKRFPVEYFIEDSSLSATKNVAPPEVASTPEELFQAAMDSKNSRQRIGIYEELLKKFPESKYASQAQFMIGFIYSEELKDYAKAEEAFKVVIGKYPDSELVDSAKWMLKNMRDESQKVGTVEDVKRKASESK